MPRFPSVSAHKKVLKAALELMAEHGIDGTSMDAVARESGVSKATIYKHWADKEALLLEMLAEASGLRSRPSSILVTHARIWSICCRSGRGRIRRYGRALIRLFARMDLTECANSSASPRPMLPHRRASLLCGISA